MTHSTTDSVLQDVGSQDTTSIRSIKSSSPPSPTKLHKRQFDSSLLTSQFVARDVDESTKLCAENEWLKSQTKQQQATLDSLTSELKTIKQKYKQLKQKEEQDQERITFLEEKEQEYKTEIEALKARNKMILKESVGYDLILSGERQAYEKERQEFYQREVELTCMIDQLRTQLQELTLATLKPLSRSSSHSVIHSSDTLSDYPIQDELNQLQATINEMKKEQQEYQHQIQILERTLSDTQQECQEYKHLNHRLMEDAEMYKEMLQECPFHPIHQAHEEESDDKSQAESTSHSDTIDLTDLKKIEKDATLLNVLDNHKVVDKTLSLEEQNKQLEDQVEALTLYIQKLVQRVSHNEQLEYALHGIPVKSKVIPEAPHPSKQGFLGRLFMKKSVTRPLSIDMVPME